jgi:HSP20 family protein
MQDDMDRMFAQALGGGLMSAGQGSGSSGGMGTWAPAIEVKQRGNDLVVSAELPGIQPDEVHVEVNQDALVIQGERRQEQSSDEGGVHRTERHYGQFYRAIPLPEGANADQAKANFQHGVLEVTVPMPNARSQSRQIPITSGSLTGSQSSGSTQGSSSKGSSTGSSTGGSGGRT